MKVSSSVFIIVIASACTEKAIPFNDRFDNNTDCECQDTESYKYSTSIDLWKKYEHKEIETAHYSKILEQWRQLNEKPLGYYLDHEYRLTYIPSFGVGVTIRVVLQDSIVTFMRSDLRKDLVITNKQYRNFSYWNEFSLKLDSIFWKAPFDNKKRYPILDGTAHYLEGINSEQKHSIYRFEGVLNMTIEKEFMKPLLIYFDCNGSKRRKLNCH